MKRFYTSAAASPEHGVLLDARPLRTPLKAPLLLPAPALAEAVAAEWNAQSETLDPASMYLTKLANTAIDKTARERDKFVGEIAEYAESDLVCYRAAEPAALLARQSAAWDPVIAWSRSALDAGFIAVSGVMHRQQPETALRKFRAALERESGWALTAIHNLTTLTGSALTALMLARAAIAPETAWTAVHADEDWQIEQWGFDDEARARRASRLAEFEASCRFLELAAIPPAS